MIFDILGMLLVLSGLIAFAVSVLGVFRFDYVLNRMHAAAIGDSVGILMIAAGAALLIRELFPILKILLVLFSLWMTSPICAHLITRAEMLTNAKYAEHLSERPEGED